MRVEFQFYATLREAVGDKRIVREVDEGATVQEALEGITGEFDGLDALLFRADGGIRPHITVALNGDPIVGDPAEVTLSADDTLVLTPGVSGGRGPRLPMGTTASTNPRRRRAQAPSLAHPVPGRARPVPGRDGHVPTRARPVPGRADPASASIGPAAGGDAR